jgi:ABC-type transporter Mla MlaB component
MLRIHTETGADGVTLRLEGKLIMEWVDELVQVFTDLSREYPSRGAVRINLDEVSFVDEKGCAALAMLRRLGCELMGSGPFIAAVIEGVSSDPTA